MRSLRTQTQVSTNDVWGRATKRQVRVALVGVVRIITVTILLTENTSFLNTPGCRNLKGSFTPVKAYPATVDKFASMLRPSVFCTESDNFFNVAKEKKKKEMSNYEDLE